MPLSLKLRVKQT